MDKWYYAFKGITLAHIASEMEKRYPGSRKYFKELIEAKKGEIEIYDNLIK